MPKKNIVKIYGEDQYYHLYNRGANRQQIFIEPSDYAYFLSLFKRHLAGNNTNNPNYRVYKKYENEVEIVAYCLMPNHFHLLCYLKDPQGIVHLMRSVMTAYTMYFNKKYKRSGRLYESNFLATRIDSDTYLWHVSRYIHLNPIDAGLDYLTYEYSSIAYFAGSKHTSWVHTERLIDNAKDKKEYIEFLADYTSMHSDIKYLKNILASQ